MDELSFDAFTDALAARLADDARVLGLVLLGSTAAGHDRFSDHDLFVVSAPGRQEELRTDLAWLPPGAEPVLVLRETEHGLKVLLGDGHLLEVAVFDLAELGVARVNRYRVVLDAGGVAERMAEVASAGAAARDRRAGPEHHLAQVVTCALVGALRQRRGETLSGRFLVTSLAVRHAVELVTATLEPRESGVLDDLDPLRRFERAYPEIGGELEALARQAPDAAASALLDLVERVVRPLRPELAWESVGVARERLQRA
jgi:hypothetical protein